MSDKNPFPFWNTDWVEAQRKYMEAWSALSGVEAGGKSDSTSTGNGQDANPWQKALEFWWQSMAQTAPGETQDFYSKIIDQTQAFYFVTDQLSRFMQGLAEISQNPEGWQDKLDQQFNEMKDYVGRQNSEASQVLKGMFGAWQLPMDTLQRTFSSGSLFPGDFLQGMKPDAMGEVTDKFLSVPGVGYSRESQEQVQEGLRLWARYQRTAQEYQLEMNKISMAALDIMKQRILEMAENDEQITTLREIYDLWVDSNEAAYAEYVFTDEYSELYGRLTNDLMALKQHGQGFIDETASAMGMPTRKSIGTMQKRQQQLRRDLIASKNRIEELEDKLDKVDALEREVRSLKSGQASADSNTAATSKKKVSKKKTGKKKTSSKKTG